MPFPFTLTEIRSLQNLNRPDTTRYKQQIMALCKKNNIVPISLLAVEKHDQVLKLYAILLTYLDNANILSFELYQKIHSYFFNPSKGPMRLASFMGPMSIINELNFLLSGIEVLRVIHKDNVEKLLTYLAEAENKSNVGIRNFAANLNAANDAPVRKIILGNILQDTTDEHFNKLHPFLKLLQVEQMLQELQKQISTMPNSSPGGVKAILVMPEYFFANSNELGLSRQINQEEARDIEKVLVEFSLKHPEILIAAPMAWKKPVLYQDAYSQAKCNKEFYEQDKLSRGITTRSDDHDKYLAKQKSGNARLTKIKAILNSAAGKRFSVSQIFHHANDPAAKLKILASSTHQDDVEVARTTVRFYLNGKLLGKVHKSADFQEVRDRSPTVFAQGTDFPEVVVDPQLRIGVEICYEHYLGVLKNAYEQRANPAQPDIHMIFSASVPNEPKHVYLEEGVLIHSSSNHEYIRYQKYNKGSIQDLPHYRISSIPLEITMLELPDLPPSPPTATLTMGR